MAARETANTGTRGNFFRAATAAGLPLPGGAGTGGLGGHEGASFFFLDFFRWDGWPGPAQAASSGGKVGSDGGVDPGVVGVEQSFFLGGHLGGVHGVPVEGGEGQGLEAQEGAEVRLALFHAQDQVFQADAEVPVEVDAGFIRGDHAGGQGGFFAQGAPADALGPLMDAQQITDAVAGAVVEVQTQVPQGLAGQVVQVQAGAAGAEDGGSEMQVAPEDGSVAGLLPVGQGAHGIGAGCSRWCRCSSARRCRPEERRPAEWARRFPGWGSSGRWRCAPRWPGSGSKLGSR